jgi:hypothetical protein
VRLLERRRVSPAGSLLAAVVYVYGGVFVSLAPWGHLVVAAWLPWTLFVAEGLVTAPTPRGFLALTAMFAAQLFAGAPETFLQGFFLVLAATLVTTGEAGVSARLRRIGVAIAVAAGIASVQLLPAVERVLDSERAGGLRKEVVMLFSIEPSTFLTFLSPHRIEGGVIGGIPESEFPLLWSVYVGIAPLLLAGLAAATRAGRRWVVVLLAALVLALGKHTPVFPALHDALPGIIGVFRYPSKLMLSAHFALSMLVGLGAALLERRVGARLRPGMVTGCLVLLSAIDLWSVHFPAMLFTDWVSLHRSAPPPELSGSDPAARLFHYQRSDGALEPWNPAFGLGDDLRAFERNVWADLGANVALVYGIGFVAEAAGLRARRSADLYATLKDLSPQRGVRLLRALGVDALVGDGVLDLSGLERLRRGERGRASIYRIIAPSPRVYVASEVRGAHGATAAFEALSERGFSPGESAVVEGSCPKPLDCGSRAEWRAAVSVVREEPERLEIETTVPAGALLVVGDAWDPGWVAERNGARARILPTNGLVRGVVLEPGPNRVVFRYEPASFRTGLVLSFVGLAVAVPLARWTPFRGSSGSRR